MPLLHFGGRLHPMLRRGGLGFREAITLSRNITSHGQNIRVPHLLIMSRFRRKFRWRPHQRQDPDDLDEQELQIRPPELDFWQEAVCHLAEGLSASIPQFGLHLPESRLVQKVAALARMFFS
jgi:hypothetical protein